jgi:uroporphyrinogen decarboxylase
MTPIERFKTTLQFQEPDRVPWTPFFLGASSRIYGAPYDQWYQYGDIAAKSMLATQKFFNFDVVLAGFDAFTESAGFGRKMIFPEDQPAYPDPEDTVIQTPDDYARLTPYDPDKHGTRTRELWECCDMLVSETGGDVPVIAMINGPLTVMNGLCSSDRLLRDCTRHREAVLSGLEIISKVLTDYTKALANTGVMIMFDMSWASKQIMDRQAWMETEGRFMPGLAETARQAGAFLSAYSRGQGPYFDLIIDATAPQLIGAAAFPDDCADWAHAKRKWGEKTALFGAVSGETLASGKFDEIKASCKRFIHELGSGGGFILAPGSEYPLKANLHGARAIREAVEAYGSYPLAASD